MKKLLHNACERSIRYLEEIQLRAVAPSQEALSDLKQLYVKLPEHPGAAENTLRILDEVISPATMGMAGPWFFGFVIGGSLPVALAANWLAGAWNSMDGWHSLAKSNSHAH